MTILPSAAFRFVLVEPRYPGNVGSTARVLKNLGFRRLALVAPECSIDDKDARRLAVDAGDLLDAAEVSPGLDAALGAAATVVGTSRRMGGSAGRISGSTSWRRVWCAWRSEGTWRCSSAGRRTA